MQERLEAHWLGRGLLSSAIVVILIAMVLPNLPLGSRLGSAQAEPVRPLTDLTGLHEGWGMFGTIERAGTVYLSALIRYDDGSVERWELPREGKLLSTYTNYRWRQLSYQVLRSSRLQAQLARWIADRHRTEGKDPTEVHLVSRFRPTPPPGADAQPPWSSKVLYRHLVPPERR